MFCVGKERENMMNKTREIAITVIALVIVVAGLYFFPKTTEKREGSKKIAIKIAVNGGIVYEDSVYTDAETLDKLLIEMKNAGKIMLEYDDSTSGIIITGMGKDKLYINESGKGMYWVHTSTNNEKCVANGFCDTIDSIIINDKDSFEFNLSGMVAF